MQYKALTLGLFLVGTALGSNALTLGKARGAAWIGQPLELVVPVQIEAGQSDGELCAQADVFHGDSRQEPGRVQVQQSPGDQPDTVNLKISSSALIDEPVVSVYVRAGCGQKSSRKFVLLADFPNEATPNPSRLTAPTAVPTPSAAPAIPPSSATSPLPPPVTSALAGSDRPAKPPGPSRAAATLTNKAVKTRRPKQPLVTGARPAQVTQQAKLEGMPRLRLDPIEEFGERVRSLEATSATANVQDDIARDSHKLQALENDSRSLLDQAAKNEAALAAIRARLEKMQGNDVPMAVVYGLLVLVLLALGAVAFLWKQRTRHVAWTGAGLRTSAASAKETGIDLDLS